MARRLLIAAALAGAGVSASASPAAVLILGAVAGLQADSQTVGWMIFSAICAVYALKKLRFL
ncbi:hypothetical protein [Ideonella sp.]|uniref:hypothetical protein n=1 Tax=Ideonella sp. TaxID=1929293 RepID=UPI00351B1B77